MKGFKHITNYYQGNKTATLVIDRKIHEDRTKGINGSDFAREMKYLASEGVESVIININSVGGSVIQGYNIFGAIKDAPFHTTTRVIGIAASMAGIISQAGDVRKIVDYGILHAHGPQVPEGVTVEGSLILKMLESLKIMIAAKTNLSEGKISEIMGKETVLTAVEALELGFFDEIEKTKGNSPVLSSSSNVEALFAITNEFINKNERMDNLNKLLGLESATEEVIVNAVTEIKAEAEKAETLTNDLVLKNTEIETLTNEATANAEKIILLENEIKTSKALNAETVVNSAIAAGKITKDSKAVWLEQATNNFEATQKLIEGLTTSKVAAKITDELNTGDDVENSKNWDFAAWGEKNPEGLDKMRNEAPEQFNKLYNEYIK